MNENDSIVKLRFIAICLYFFTASIIIQIQVLIHVERVYIYIVWIFLQALYPRAWPSALSPTWSASHPSMPSCCPPSLSLHSNSVVFPSIISYEGTNWLTSDPWYSNDLCSALRIMNSIDCCVFYGAKLPNGFERSKKII